MATDHLAPRSPSLMPTASGKTLTAPVKFDHCSATDWKAIHLPSQQCGKAPAIPAAPIKQGGKAAIEVYQTLELRQKIFSYVDRAMLLRMLVLERAVMASIAGILYRSVHISEVCYMSRNNTDDSYILHLSGETDILQLETHFHISIYPFPTTGIPLLPHTPEYYGVIVDHTIALTVSGAYRPGAYDKYALGSFLPDTPKPTLGLWRAWVFTDPDLDSRISSIDCEPQLKPTFDEVMAFTSHRRDNPLPAQSFTLPPVERLTVAQFGKIVSSLGRQLRTLYIRTPIIDTYQDWPAVITLLDEAFPSLQKLDISGNSRISPGAVLSGLGQLKEFRFPCAQHVGENPLALAQSIHQIGAPSCSFHPISCGEKFRRVFHRLVACLRSSDPKHRSLHALTALELDLFTTADIEAYVFGTNGGQIRRLALNVTSNHADELSKAQDKVNIVISRQQQSVQSFQQTLDRIMTSGDDAGGDTRAQTAIIKHEFERSLEEQKEMEEACMAMRNITWEVEKQSRMLTQYAQTWLKCQDGRVGLGEL